MNNELTIARTAYKDGDYEKARESYDRAYQNDPTLMEARFFASYCRLLSCKYGDAFTNMMSFSTTAISTVNDLPSKGSDSDVKSLLNDMSKALSILPDFMSDIQKELWQAAPEGDKAKYNEKKKTAEARAISLLLSFGDSIEKNYREHISIAADVWKEGIKAYAKYPYCGVKKELYQTYTDKIKKIDPSYEAPKKSGCISFS